MALSSPWRLVVPFTTSPVLPIKEEFHGSIGSYSFTVHPASGEGNDGSAFLVEGIPSVEIARSLFDALKRAVVAASLNVPCGVRIGSALEVVEHVNCQLPSDPTTPYICPQSMSGARLTITWGQASFQANKVVPRFRDGLVLGLREDLINGRLEGKLNLACKLYIDSFYEASVEARFLTLVGVLEVLKDKAERSEGAIHLIDGWLREMNGFEGDDKASLIGKLQDLKQLSIGQGIRRMVSRYLGEDRAREAARIYGVRSKLVHEGAIGGDLRESFDLAEDIVRRLLVALLFGGRATLSE